jgi:hypothetical protein
MEISWIAKESEIIYEIVSSDGRRVQIFLPHGYIIQRTQESPANVEAVACNLITDLKRLYKKWAKFAVDQVKKPRSGHFDLISNYIESLEKNLISPVTGEDGRNAVRLLECIDESLNTQKPVSFLRW